MSTEALMHIIQDTKLRLSETDPYSSMYQDLLALLMTMQDSLIYKLTEGK